MVETSIFIIYKKYIYKQKKNYIKKRKQNKTGFPILTNGKWPQFKYLIIIITRTKFINKQKMQYRYLYKSSNFQYQTRPVDH